MSLCLVNFNVFPSLSSQRWHGFLGGKQGYLITRMTVCFETSGSKEKIQTAKGAQILLEQKTFKTVDFMNHDHLSNYSGTTVRILHIWPWMTISSAHFRNISYFLSLETPPTVYSVHAFLAGVQILSAKDNMNDAFNNYKAWNNILSVFHNPRATLVFFIAPGEISLSRLPCSHVS